MCPTEKIYSMRRCIMEILFHCLHTTSKHPHISHLSKFCRLQNQLQIFVNEVSIYEYNWFDCMISTHVESIESVDKFHDFLAEVDKYQIDTLLVAETWRDEHEEIFLTVHGHRFSLSGGSLTWSTWCWKWFLSKICLPKKVLLFLFTWGSASSRFHLEVPARIHVPSAKDSFSCKGIEREAHSVARR